MTDLDQDLVLASYLRREAETTTDFRQRERCTDAYKAIEKLVEQRNAARELIEAIDAERAVEGNYFDPGTPEEQKAATVVHIKATIRKADARAEWDRVK